MRELWGRLGGAAKAVIVAGIGGFVIRLSSTTVSGGDCSYIDIGALGAGVICGVAGVVALVTRSAGRGSADGSGWSMTPDRVLGLVGVLLAVVHLMRGVGAIGGPC